MARQTNRPTKTAKAKTTSRSSDIVKDNKEHELLETITGILHDKEQVHDAPVTYVNDDDLPMFYLRMMVSGVRSDYRVIISSECRGKCIMVTSVSPLRVPKKRREPILEYINRANYGRVHSALQMDMQDGEISMRTSLDFGYIPCTRNVLDDLINQSVFSLDYVYPAIAAVITGECTPEEAEKRLFEDPTNDD